MDAVAYTNLNFRITAWNSAAEKLYGWPADDAVGKNIDDLLGTRYPAGFKDTFASLMKSGSVELELTQETRNGRTVRVRAVLLLEDTGDGPAQVLHTFEEITRKGIEPKGAMPEDGKRLMEMLDGAAQDIWIYDIPSNIEWHSGEWEKRIGDPTTGGEPAGTVLPEDMDEVRAAIKAAVAARKPSFRLQYRAIGVNGGQAWSLTQGKISYGEDGKPMRITGATIDITEMKNMELQLQAQARLLEQQALELADKNRMMTDFFTNVSHEFKTPLSIILVDLQLMEYRLRDSAGGELRDKLGRTVSIMRQNALRLLRLIGNLLDVTKIEAGFMKARLINADIVAVVAGLTESVRNYAKNAGIDLAFTSDKSYKLMAVDSEKLERILLNLLSNAIKHTPSGGHITVALKDSDTVVTLSVKDDGEGIAEERKEIIFDRFRQANSSMTRASEGCGIGLALTKALVELLQGRMWFESRVGQGSEFFVELPVLQADWQAQALDTDGMTRDRKVEMEFSDVGKQER